MTIRSSQPAPRCAGQAMAEYLVVLAAVLLGAAAAGLFGEDGGLLGQLLGALKGFHQRFSMVLSWPV